MDEWQPIETAPTDGDPVLLFGRWEGELHDRDDNPGIYQAYYWDGDWYCTGGEYYSAYVRNPTHWMPLPKPPVSGEAE